MFRMIRSFIPVGQGAFYREHFHIGNSNYNIVYDCGSSTDEDLIKKRIDEEFCDDDEIDAVFVSHFHEDHINGLEHLFKKHVVKKVFMPYISIEDKKLMKLKLLSDGFGVGSFSYRFLDLQIEMPRGHETQFIYVGERKTIVNEIEGIEGKRNFQIINNGDDVAKEIFEDNCPEWHFAPFNFRQESRVKNVLKKLKNKKIDLNGDIGNIFSEKNKKIICEIFKKIPGDFNTNSMVLYSGLSSKNHADICDCYCHCHCNCMKCRKSCGCLYFGDYDAKGKKKWNELKSSYDMYWRNIGCIQIPHHGSKHNFNDEICEIDACKIISAGIGNNYGHPHQIVLNKLAYGKGSFNIVTQNPCSRRDFLIHFE